ncbi:hypothetical protein LA6_001082 [Marinibacterium anthonyi]|nr:hypothetical protein LA6_001082 [Marinibacterium anthonyi]
MSRFIAILIACSVATAALGWGQGYDKDTTLNSQTTSALIYQMQQDFKRCFRLEKNYRYDCYDEAYYRSARKISRNPAYAPATAALDEVGRKITAIVDANRDPNLPVLRQGFNTYRPIRTEALPASKEKVAEAIEEARTILLRTPENGGDNFQRIAAALESNKVLLRSALLLIGAILAIV